MKNELYPCYYSTRSHTCSNFTVGWTYGDPDGHQHTIICPAEDKRIKKAFGRTNGPQNSSGMG